MNETISLAIEKIRSKSLELKSKLNSTEKENENLKVELTNLDLKIKELEAVKTNLDKELEIATNENIELKNQRIKSGNIDGNLDLEIDFLVREIDTCISQIKSNL